RRALGVVLGIQIREELANRKRRAVDLLLVDRLGKSHVQPRLGRLLPDLAAEELAELHQVCSVAFDGVVGEVLLELQILEELLDERRMILRLLRLRLWGDARL